MAQISEALKQARKAAGLTQSRLAATLGIKQPTLAQFEDGHRPLPLKHYGKLPDSIRSKVIDAALCELGRQAEELEALR